MAHQYSPLEEKLKDYTEHNGCWDYNGRTNDSGYALFMVDHKLKYAHRWAYEFYKGEIPDGMTVDHICFNRKCINPEHLRLLSWSENAKRWAAPQQIKTWCDKHNCPRKIKLEKHKNGNTTRHSVCLKCASEHTAAYKKRKRTGGGIG